MHTHAYTRKIIALPQACNDQVQQNNSNLFGLFQALSDLQSKEKLEDVVKGLLTRNFQFARKPLQAKCVYAKETPYLKHYTHHLHTYKTYLPSR